MRTETVTYSDGTTATGTAPRPDLSPAQQGRPVAWLHDEEGRYDVVHDEAKALWLQARPRQVERYTIPLYLHKPLSTDAACALIAETIGRSAMRDGNLLKLLRAVERAHGISATHELRIFDAPRLGPEHAEVLQD